MKASRSYILRIENDGRATQFWVQDIKTGERHCFQSWQALKNHLQGEKRKGLR
jgi:hypothetical protein